MKKIKKILNSVLTLIIIFNLIYSPPAFAASSNPKHDLYADNNEETINIGGINYTYQYFYENGNRTIMISNDANNKIDKVFFDESASVIYLNNDVFARVKTFNQATPHAARIGWETLTSESHLITWDEGVAVGIVTAALAIYLGTLGTAGVIAAMGVGTLTVLATSSVGGTLYVNLQMYNVPLVTPQYRYEWSFTASTGDSYGPYYFDA